MKKPNEKALLKQIAQGDEKAFGMLFQAYYANLCRFATEIISDEEEAEEIVQDLFVKIWEKKAQLTIDSSIKNYLYRAVKNQCVNFIKHNKTINKHISTQLSEKKFDLHPEEHFLASELAQKIEESIESLPEKRREIFKLSREEGLKYREIAKKLNLSIKTVEAQMGLAIKTLRNKLKNHISFLTLLLCFF